MMWEVTGPIWTLQLKIDTKTRQVLGAVILSNKLPSCVDGECYIALPGEFENYEDAMKRLECPMFDWIGELHSNTEGDRIWRGDLTP